MLRDFFSPKSIAVIGASRNKEKLGSLVYKNIQKYGFKGKVYGVNVKGGSIGGDKLYETLSGIEGTVDLAVVVVPAKAVSAVIRDCGEKGIRSVIIISAGFSETGVNGKKLETAIMETASEYDMRILGPNCLGIIDSWSKMNASFAESMPDPMSISLLSQSGAICTAILDWAGYNEIGFSRFVSMGNKLDIDENDILDFLYHDDKTKVVLGYLESIHDGKRFMENARKLVAKKPLIIVKSGKTRDGARTVSSHTGSVTGSSVAVSAAFDECGVVQADSLEDLFDFARIFSFSPEMKGDRVTIISNAGGPAVMTADALDKTALKLAKFSPKVKRVLVENLPAEAATDNPIDILGDALSDRYRLAIGETIKDENVDALIVILTPQVMTEVEKTAKIIVDAKKHGKPVAACFMGGTRVEPVVDFLEENKVAVYNFPERAVKSLDVLYKYHEFRKKLNEKSENVGQGNYKKAKAERIIREASQRKSRNVSQGEYGVFDVFDAYGIETVRRAYSENWGQLKEGAIKVGYPVVLKTAVSGVVHRTEVGGVVVGIEDRKALAQAYNSIKGKIGKVFPHENSQAMTVYKMEEEGVEIFIGAKRDSSFGPVVVFGIGGIYVEAFQDLSYRIAPVSRTEALKMIDDIKAAKILHGFRGRQKCDIDKIIRSIMGISQLMIDFPEIKEIDINPLKVTDKKCVAVDGKIILDLQLERVKELV